MHVSSWKKNARKTEHFSSNSCARVNKIRKGTREQTLTAHKGQKDLVVQSFLYAYT